jgi:hypothetical protein
MIPINLETAKLLNSITNDFLHYKDSYKEEGIFYPAPIQEEVIEWLWIKHKILVQTPLRMPYYKENDIHFIITIQEQGYDPDKKETIFFYGEDDVFYDRNVAMEEGIIKALKLI